MRGDALAPQHLGVRAKMVAGGGAGYRPIAWRRAGQSMPSVRARRKHKKLEETRRNIPLEPDEARIADWNFTGEARR